MARLETPSLVPLMTNVTSASIYLIAQGPVLREVPLLALGPRKVRVYRKQLRAQEKLDSSSLRLHQVEWKSLKWTSEGQRRALLAVSCLYYAEAASVVRSRSLPFITQD